MRKVFKFYLVVWGVLLGLFNVISFVSVGWKGQEKYTDSFWIGYIFIMLCFAGQLVCTYYAMKSDHIKKAVYNLSLIKTSYAGLVLSFIFGGLCMLISVLPYWIGILLCSIVLTLNVLSVVKASVAVYTVSKMDEELKVKTVFIKSLCVDAEGLIASAKNDEMKAVCKKVYEAVRYSDPMSNDALASVENQITIKFAMLLDAVKAEDSDNVTKIADEALILINERNIKCRVLK